MTEASYRPFDYIIISYVMGLSIACYAQKSADLGEIEGLHNLGRYYCDGFGIIKDLEKLDT
ncbi:2876_t:CDS:2 [Cetraspora pellucida]|uniref:2876_t:CDS:1 n=1 Tax=Cetraspora pellucida TaxID=1433469 RepID=A0ACA9L993_9GLOM|nr:2876_t:CDS:2 [Cetraspora pellucida]